MDRAAMMRKQSQQMDDLFFNCARCGANEYLEVRLVIMVSAVPGRSNDLLDGAHSNLTEEKGVTALHNGLNCT